MSYEQTYHQLISGQRKGPGAVLLRFLLRIVSLGYCIVVRFRNFLYDIGLFKTCHVDATVICIGNITVGGTGKTPLVIWLCNRVPDFKSHNCAVLTRGYKSQTQQQASRMDEVAILTENCPEAKVFVNPDRVAGAAEAINKFGAKVLIMDDGFQHRRLARDLDILAIDAMRPFGYGKMFPAGLLREPVTSLKRADAVIITRCDHISEDELKLIESKLISINPKMVTVRSIHAPVNVRTIDGRRVDVEMLKGKKVFAFCGIGNPDAFLDTIRRLGAQIVGSKVYNDHYQYTDNCIVDIHRRAESLKADLVLTTKKDWTKIISNLKSQISDSKMVPPFAYLEIEIKFIAGEDKLTHLIEKTLAGTIS